MSIQSQVSESYNSAKETVKNINESALSTGEEILSEIVKGGEQWIALGKKAIDGGVELAGKQQEVNLSAMEEVKTQLKDSTDRFKKIVGLEA